MYIYTCYACIYIYIYIYIHISYIHIYTHIHVAVSTLFFVLKPTTQQLLYWKVMYQNRISRASSQESNLCRTTDMSAMSHSRHVCCVTQHTCVLCRHVCCVTQQTCLLCHKPHVSAVARSRHFCCVTQQTCHTADISAV